MQCHAVQGLYQEIKDVQKEPPPPAVLEGLVAGGAAKTEHYEIAVYTGPVTKARAMGQDQAAQTLAQNLQEEQQMLQRVEQIAQQMAQQLDSGGGT